MEHHTVVVVGAGHAGLAASHVLAEHAIDHVVLERGEVANSWRHERWDSLRLLAPNRQSRLPGAQYDGDDPDGYMTAVQVADLIAGYATANAAPVRTQTPVTGLRRAGDGGFDVSTPHGELRARAVVLAGGACNLPVVPRLAEAVPAGVTQITAAAYRRPEDLAEGGVLVVGASASGVQIAAELLRSGRPVTLAVGEHVRMPRTYRGADVLWWMEATGVWAQRAHEVDDLERARRLPSPQLAGTPERATLDLDALTALGAELVGRWASVRDGHALFSGGLSNVLSLADLKLRRLLDGFDAWALAAGIDGSFGAPERPAPTAAPGSPRWRIDLGSGEIRTVVWACGYRPDHSWLHVPHVVDGKGRLRHDGGVVVDCPGLYALGLPVLRRRGSTFICGIEDDTREVVGLLAAELAGRHALAPAA